MLSECPTPSALTSAVARRDRARGEAANSNAVVSASRSSAPLALLGEASAAPEGETSAAQGPRRVHDARRACAATPGLRVVDKRSREPTEAPRGLSVGVAHVERERGDPRRRSVASLNA